MKVREIMSDQVFTVNQYATIKECGDVLEKHNINGVPVVDGERVVGFITRYDIFKSILPRYPELYDDEQFLMDFEYIEERIHKLQRIEVSELMGSPAITVDEESPICKAGSTMVLKKVKQIPVMRDDRLVGDHYVIRYLP